MNALDVNYVKRHSGTGIKKVQLKKTKYKGTGLFAKERISKNSVIAYYKFTVYKNDKSFKSASKNMYTFFVMSKAGRELQSVIGDLSDDSVAPAKRGIPFWGYFANEPSGKQTPNTWIDINTAENYRTKARVAPGDTMIYKLRADRTIEPGEEIVWCYGDEYVRDYVADACN